MIQQEKYSIIVTTSVLVLVYLAYNVFDPLYSHFMMGESFPLSNIRVFEWQNSVGMGLLALSGLQMVVSVAVFSLAIFDRTTTAIYPGIFFFFAAYISIPLMIKLTAGIPRWKGILYIYLVATQISAPILAYWTNFGA